jgi:hypothetical protein
MFSIQIAGETTGNCPVHPIIASLARHGAFLAVGFICNPEGLIV